MTKTSQIQAWLNGFYMENLYGQRMTSKHVHARRRPGTRDDKTQANLAPPLAQQAVRRSRISKSKSDLVAHDSGSWGVRLLHDVLASLNLRCFGHETMSVDLSIGLCCVISVIVCKFCVLRLALLIANKPTPPKYSNRSANTQYHAI